MPTSARRQTRRSGIHEIGEGRSKSTYIEPLVEDTAVLLCFYSPAKFKRILANILYVIETLKEKDIPFYVAECVFPGGRPQIPGATLVVHSDSYMFYKEQLLNMLEPKVPAQYTKLICMDGDLVFDAPNWVDMVSDLLNHVDICQPFADACWLTPDNTRIRMRKPSYAYGLVHRRMKSSTPIHTYHPGFAWAFRRETFRALGGFYPRAIVGNGDMLFTFNFFKDAIPEHFINDQLHTRITIDAWADYHANFKRVNPTLGYVGIRIFHLFHGLREDRQYKTRYTSIASHLPPTWDECIKVNADGLYEFKDPTLSKLVLAYFKARNEDIPLEEAMRRTVEDTRKSIRPPRKIQANGENWSAKHNLPHA